MKLTKVERELLLVILFKDKADAQNSVDFYEQGNRGKQWLDYYKSRVETLESLIGKVNNENPNQ